MNETGIWQHIIKNTSSTTLLPCLPLATLGYISPKYDESKFVCGFKVCIVGFRGGALHGCGNKLLIA